MNEIARAESFEQVDQFEAWRIALATGKPVAYERGSPTAGYFKCRDRNRDRSIRWDAVGIWKEGATWYCQRTGRRAPEGTDEIEELFVNCNSSPIPYELFVSVMAGEPWPDHIAAPEVADNLPPHEAAIAELAALQQTAKAWLHGLGHKPATQEEADKAANYADAFAKLEKKADKTRETEKAPHLEAGREVDAKWKPTIEGAGVAKKWAKGLSDDFAIAETVRRKREADEENARRQREFAEAKRREDERIANEERLRAKGVQLPEMARPPVEAPKTVVAEAVKIGTTGRRHSPRTVPTYELIDGSALLHFLADRNERSLKLLDAALADGKTLCEAGMIVPGIKVGTTEKMV